MENQNNQLAVVQKGLENFNNLKKELVEMQSTSKELVFTNFDDKDNNNKIVETRKLFKSKRVEIEKAGKLLRDQINPVIKEILSKEKELIAVIEPEEKRLMEIEKSIEADKEAKRLEKERAEMEKVQTRCNKLLEFGHVADFYTVKSWTDEQFEHELKSVIQLHEQEQARLETERIHAEQLERERIEQERIEREAMEAERLEQEKIKAEQEQIRIAQEKIQQQQEAEAKRIQDEKDQILIQKEKIIMQEIDLLFQKRANILLEWCSEVSIRLIDGLGTMTDDEFEKVKQAAIWNSEEVKKLMKLEEEKAIKEKEEVSKFEKAIAETASKNERFPADDEHKEIIKCETDAVEFGEWLRTFDALTRVNGHWCLESQISTEQLYHHFLAWKRNETLTGVKS